MCSRSDGWMAVVLRVWWGCRPRSPPGCVVLVSGEGGPIPISLYLLCAAPWWRGRGIPRYVAASQHSSGFLWALSDPLDQWSVDGWDQFKILYWTFPKKLRWASFGTQWQGDGRYPGHLHCVGMKEVQDSTSVYCNGLCLLFFNGLWFPFISICITLIFTLSFLSVAFYFVICYLSLLLWYINFEDPEELCHWFFSNQYDRLCEESRWEDGIDGIPVPELLWTHQIDGGVAK